MSLKKSELAIVLSSRQRRRGILLILAIGIVLFFWQLGSTGLVDETPPLFAAAGREMSDSGDWLTPTVNGLPRYDKPPLVYWFMAVFYSLPWQDIWDPLGTWSARLPSAISSLLMMIALADTTMCWPQLNDTYPRRTAVAVSLAFALSPLVMIWSRIPVSDALLCSTLGLSLLWNWRSYVSPKNERWWAAWVFLGLAILTKGPVAIVISILTLIIFGSVQNDLDCLRKRIKPLKGLLISISISLPWYLLELFVEGKPFWDSFFGYHNFQRFTSVVNGHMQPWWFFLMILVLASLPFTPLLFLGLVKSWPSKVIKKGPLPIFREQSLRCFAFCWLVSVFFFFTFAATKLPSYWLPATPAAALLIGLSTYSVEKTYPSFLIAWLGTIFCAFVLAISFWAFPLWIKLISFPEMPNLSGELLASNLIIRSAIFFSSCVLIGCFYSAWPRSLRLLSMQIPLFLFHFFAYVPMWELADNVRQFDLRKAAEMMRFSQNKNEPLVMVGIVKPSIHFYTRQVVVYEGPSKRDFVNLSDRLKKEERFGWFDSLPENQVRYKTLILLIDKNTVNSSHWKEIQKEPLGTFGIYSVWRIDLVKLERKAKELQNLGIIPDWQIYRPERY